MFARVLGHSRNHSLVRAFSGSKVRVLPGSTPASPESTLQTDNSHVRLRGINITGKKEDLPNLIFYPDVFDSAENWITFFADKHSQVPATD